MPAVNGPVPALVMSPIVSVFPSVRLARRSSAAEAFAVVLVTTNPLNDRLFVLACVMFVSATSETGAEIQVEAEGFRAEYRKRVNDFCSHVRQECTKLEIDCELLRTDSPLDVAMMTYLEKRAAC